MRSSNRRHERQTFTKYMSVETALAVLATRTLRWSSPLLFNDPFDVPRELSFGLTPAEIVSALKEQLADLIQEAPRRVKGDAPRSVERESGYAKGNVEGMGPDVPHPLSV
jgi:hypothetical protein